MMARGSESVLKLLHGYRRLRGFTYEVVTPHRGGRLGRLFDWVIMIVITINVVSTILSTVESLYVPYPGVFYWVEVGSVAIFTVEYIIRVWSAIEGPEWNGVLSGRLWFSAQPLMIVDLLAILPFYVLAAGSGVDLRVLRSLRLVRVLRMLKLARYSESLRAFKRVFKRKYPDLVIALFANVLLLVVSSSVMYFVETRVQPEVFSSIPVTMLWGVSALTEADLTGGQPVTPVGKVLGAVVAALGIGLFALPASILASGFIKEAGTDNGTEITYCPHCGEEIRSKSHDQMDHRE